MSKLSFQKGFTLIELLIVIAILGILAAVVLVAINPAQRIAEANDTKAKSNVSVVATAIESCFTNQPTVDAGTYRNNCSTPLLLQTNGWLKQDLSAAALGNAAVTINTTATTNVEADAFALVTASSAACATGSGPVKFITYRTVTGKTQIECYAAATAAPTAP